METMQKTHKAYCLRPNGEAVIVDGIRHWADEQKPYALYVRDYNENLKVIALLTEEEENILWNLMSKEREDAKRKNEGMGRTR